MRRKILAVVLAVALMLSVAVTAYAIDGEPGATKDSSSVVVLFTNDVHCAVDSGLGYAGVAQYKKDMQEQYENVVLADAGDHIQGGAMGALSKGEYIIDIMDVVGYDIATLGNHEFDYGLDRIVELANKAYYSYVSCNVVKTDSEDAPLFDAYKIFTFGEGENETKVAFVGVTTPDTFTQSTPTYFQNEEGEYIYGFCQGNDGQELYDRVQKSVDDAKEEGADYVIALAHLGDNDESKPWTSAEVISHTKGIDALIDGHSHHKYDTDVNNSEEEPVKLVQTGTALSSLGKLVIDGRGNIAAEFIDAPEYDAETGVLTNNGYEGKNAEVEEYVNGVKADLAEKLNEVVAKTNYDLVINDPAVTDSVVRIVRKQETNLGDICADAYKDLTGADVAFVNGGGVRKDIKAGDITFNDIIDVHPFGNLACMVEVTGQQILDALEWGSRACPGETGGFLQVAGLKYTIDTTIESTCTQDEFGAFTGVAGERRVKDVYLVAEDDTETPIDPEATYKLASHNYMLKDAGDGFAMFKGTNVLLDEIMIDNEVLIRYFQSIVDENLYIPDTYADPYGLGRITILTEEDNNSDTDNSDTDNTDTENTDTENSDTDTTDSEEFMFGDVNRDKVVDMHDVVDLQKHLAELEIDIDLRAAEVTGDDKVNMEDVVDIQRFIAELFDKFKADKAEDTEVDTEANTEVDTESTTEEATSDTAVDTNSEESTNSDDTNTEESTNSDDTNTEESTNSDDTNTDTEPNTNTEGV